jgi:hypothetical protein
MKERLRFDKEFNGWFVDLPEWSGSKADLQMVLGADTWLDLLCDGEWYVWIVLSDKPFEGSEELKKISDGWLYDEGCGSGATYKVESYMGIPFDIKMWLCDVTKFVFGSLPDTIYYKKS